MKLSVLNKEGKDTGRKADLKDSIFSIEPNDHAIYLDVKQTQANKRQGTSKAKERGEITGSRKKLKKQKGTGTARVGDIKNPLFRGGGRLFGPKPRTYSSKLNKKVKQLARFSALSYKAKNKELFVLEDLKFDAPKTKEFVNVLNNLKVADKKALVVLAEKNDSVLLSSRNIPNSKVILSSELNTYDIMNASALILCEGSIESIQLNA